MKEAVSFELREERKRKLISLGVTAGLYALGLGVGILLGVLNPQEQAYSNTTVVLNLAGPATPELGLGSVTPSEKGETLKEIEPPAPAKSSAAETAKLDEPKVKAIEKPKETTSPAPAMPKSASAAPASVSPETVAPTQNLGAPAASPPPDAAPPEPWVPGERGPGSRLTSTNSSVLVPGKGNVPFAKGNPTVITKAERGNSSETTLGGAQGTVGHNIYVPIYSNMPLPREVPAGIFENIPDLIQPPSTVIHSARARKQAFLAYYEYADGVYRMKNEVPLDQREPLWQILEDAKYSADQADYKQGRSLMPVVIGFSVTRDNQLRGVEILQSSGDPEIDRSVVYGFKRAAFWNKTGETVPGRFTYRF
jgi:TonB family protein